MSDSPDRVNPLPPRARPRAAGWLIFFTLLWAGILAVAIHDALVLYGYAPRPGWVSTVLPYLSPARYPVLTILAVIALPLGLILLVHSLLPAQKTHRAVISEQGASLWMRPVDVSRMCTAAAQSAAGITRAHTVSTPSKVTVTVHTAGPVSDEILDEVRDRVESRLAHLEKVPDATIRVAQKKGGH